MLGLVPVQGLILGTKAMAEEFQRAKMQTTTKDTPDEKTAKPMTGQQTKNQLSR